MGTTFDLNKRELHIATLSSQRAKWTLNKGEQGEVDLLKALTPQKSEVPAGSPEDATAQAEAGWKLSLGEAILAGWGLRFEDRSWQCASEPESAGFWAGPRLIGKTLPGTARLLNWRQGFSSKGRLALGGKFASDPLEASIKADLRDVDLLAVQPYVDQHYKVLVTRGNLTGKGKLEVSLANAESRR